MSFSVNDSPYRRARRRQGPEPRHPRPPRARGRGQCRDPRHHGAPTTTASRSPAAASSSSACSSRPCAAKASSSAISRPRVLFRDGPNGREEPYETVVVDVDDEFSGTVIDKMALRKARDDRHAPVGRRQDPPDLLGAQPRPHRLSRRVPVRHPRHRHHEPPVRALRPLQGPDRRAARTASSSRWSRAPRSLMRSNALEERGVLFVSPGEMLYEGMVIGENAKTQDLEVNPLKSKQLTNFRACGPKDEGIRLTPPAPHEPRAGDRLHPGRRAGRGHAQGRSASASATSTRMSASGTRGKLRRRRAPLLELRRRDDRSAGPALDEDRRTKAPVRRRWQSQCESCVRSIRRATTWTARHCDGRWCARRFRRRGSGR